MTDWNNLPEPVGLGRRRTLRLEEDRAQTGPAANFAVNLPSTIAPGPAGDRPVAHPLLRSLRDEILANVRSLAATDDTAVINLALADAPSLQITVHLAGAAVSIAVTGANIETRGLLQNMLPMLRKSLAAQGMCLSNMTVDQGEEDSRGDRSIGIRELDTYA